MARIKKEVQLDDGWSRWIPPRMTGYRMACCDCGLAHDMDFRVIRVLDASDDGHEWEAAEVIADPDMRVQFRARRNNRSTAALRRQRKGGDDAS